MQNNIKLCDKNILSFKISYSILGRCDFSINTKERGIKVQHSRTYHGDTFLEEEDLKETNIKHKIQLEYYTFKETKENKYGIEIIKKEYKENKIDEESNSMQFITNNSQKVIDIINTLKEYKVTPIGLNDVLEDLLKAN